MTPNKTVRCSKGLARCVVREALGPPVPGAGCGDEVIDKARHAKLALG
jgi:hypothetical protein